MYVCVGSERGSPLTHPYAQHKNSTGFILCQHFHEVPPHHVCVVGQGPSLTPSQSHVCHSQDCSSWFLFVCLFHWDYYSSKVKETMTPNPELHAVLCLLYMTRDDIPDLCSSQDKHKHAQQLMSCSWLRLLFPPGTALFPGDVKRGAGKCLKLTWNQRFCN